MWKYDDLLPMISWLLKETKPDKFTNWDWIHPNRSRDWCSLLYEFATELKFENLRSTRIPEITQSFKKLQKIQFLDLTGDSYLGVDFRALENLKSLSIGSQKPMETPSVLNLRSSHVGDVLIDLHTLSNLPNGIKALDISKTEIQVGTMTSGNRKRPRILINLMETITYLCCKPHQLELFNVESLDNLRHLSLYYTLIEPLLDLRVIGETYHAIHPRFI
ncbi:unnamed protein product [Ambrosiozyma monospora]|uniref:Unnamed protein product n=1 Tax=Ambrosiozyma monospora TaxID=43982 RepID=A0ACB5SU59_AMBMO|nr:unnamed protein product [Ambrosiozyma monospora]